MNNYICVEVGNGFELPFITLKGAIEYCRSFTLANDGALMALCDKETGNCLCMYKDGIVIEAYE